MKCPACNQTLKEYQAAGFKIDGCVDGCGGMWFDANEFETCDQHHEAFPQELLRARKYSAAVIDRNRKRSCPRCAGTQVLQRIVLDPERYFEIDKCEACNGHWLDIGELEKIRAESKENHEIETRVSAFQRTVEQKLKDPVEARRVRAFVELLFK